MPAASLVCKRCGAHAVCQRPECHACHTLTAAQAHALRVPLVNFTSLSVLCTSPTPSVLCTSPTPSVPSTSPIASVLCTTSTPKLVCHAAVPAHTDLETPSHKSSSVQMRRASLGVVQTTKTKQHTVSRSSNETSRVSQPNTDNSGMEDTAASQRVGTSRSDTDAQAGSLASLGRAGAQGSSCKWESGRTQKIIILSASKRKHRHGEMTSCGLWCTVIRTGRSATQTTPDDRSFYLGVIAA